MPLGSITIKTDLGPKIFNSANELSNWVEKQLDAWLSEQKSLSSQRVNQIVGSWQELNDTLVRILNEDNKEIDKDEKTEKLVQRYFDEPKIILPCNPAVDLVKETGNAHTIDAFFRALMGDSQGIQLNDTNKLRGFIIGNIASGRYNEHLTPTASKLKEISNQNLHELEDLKSEIRDLIEKQSSNNKTQDELIANIETKIDLVKSGFNECVAGLKLAYDKFIDDAESKLNIIEHTYKEHMSLRASVNYWSEQENHHKFWSSICLTILVLTTITTIGTILYFGYFSIESTQKSEIALKDIPYVIAFKGLIAALILSFAIWAIRICNKTWHIHRHLKQDAKERVTMMKTYLALLSEDNLKENDVELILNSLFRPSYDGIIKDDTAPRSALDFILRDK